MSSVSQEIALGELTLTAEPRHDWSARDIAALFDQPLNDLLFAAHWVHRHNFDPNSVQVSTLLSIKTGRCPEDCAYCPQSVRFATDLDAHDLLPLDTVREAARRAKAAGATRFCMGAAYRGPKDKDLDRIVGMVEEVKALGMETCVTLGLLKGGQAERLAAAGLDYYNHNLDTSEAYYPQIISTRRYDDRLDTLTKARGAGLKLCCGGILGLGESRRDRVELLKALSAFDPQPESVPVNRLVKVSGTPLADAEDLDGFEFVRSIAVARVLMPRSQLRLSAGRSDFSDEMQALCFFAGANSIFYGDKLLTTDNPGPNHDEALFGRLGLRPEACEPAAAAD
jgi:biotin synthase